MHVVQDRICARRTGISPRKYEVARADRTAPNQQHELSNHTDHRLTALNDPRLLIVDHEAGIDGLPDV